MSGGETAKLSLGGCPTGGARPPLLSPLRSSAGLRNYGNKLSGGFEERVELSEMAGKAESSPAPGASQLHVITSEGLLLLKK